MTAPPFCTRQGDAIKKSQSIMTMAALRSPSCAFVQTELGVWAVIRFAGSPSSFFCITHASVTGGTQVAVVIPMLSAADMPDGLGSVCRIARRAVHRFSRAIQRKPKAIPPIRHLHTLELCFFRLRVSQVTDGPKRSRYPQPRNINCRFPWTSDGASAATRNARPSILKGGLYLHLLRCGSVGALGLTHPPALPDSYDLLRSPFVTNWLSE